MSKEITPRKVFDEYDAGRNFKAGLGKRGLYEQNRMNERFFVGDQWYGAKCGGERPLVRHNVIKRIGDYKIAVIGAKPTSVNFSADGVPNTLELSQHIDDIKEQVRQTQINGEIPDPTEFIKQNFGGKMATGEETELIMSALSDYFAATADRLDFEDLQERVLHDGYVSGTGVLYTTWDGNIETGMYADSKHETAIKGDITCETLDIENVYFGDPNKDDVQAQPYIVISQRKSLHDIRRIAKAHGIAEADLRGIVPDSDYGYEAGDISQSEPVDAKKATVLTRLWKVCDKQSGKVSVHAMQCVRDMVIRKEWDIGIRLYPLSVFTWERRKNCAYGDSEITYLIPNQIAINRMLTASVWAVMMMGIPLTVVNGDVVTAPISNDPGQVIKVFGNAEDVGSAIRYVNPPNFSPKFDDNVQSLITNTLSQSGANDAALGNMRPDNTSAIVAVREAATMPMQTIQNRFYRWIGDTARIWAEMWIMKYGARCLKISGENGSWYMPFDGQRYRDLIVSVHVDVGASTMWGEAQTIATLDSLLQSQIITPVQYVSRLPHGVIPKQSTLLKEVKDALQAAQEAQQAAAGQAQQDDGSGGADSIMNALPEEYKQQLAGLPPEQAQQIVQQAIGG